MEGMFDSARAFNQDISGWNVSNVKKNGMQDMFNKTPFDLMSHLHPKKTLSYRVGGRKGKTRKTNGKQKKGKQTRRKVMKQSRRKGKKTNKK
jgi:surface protein